jgi:branched-chain amino acid aminotransferase
LISPSPVLGVSAPTDAKMFVILSPVGPYFPRGFVPVKLLASSKYVRAFPGGTGEYKVGGNYCGTIVPQKEAALQGFDQILWVYGEDDIVTEAGTMNFLMHWRNKEGVEELITAPLSDGTILPGVTRDTCLALAKQWGIKTAEKRFTMKDVIDASKEGRILEAFGAGTAAIISPVKAISFKGTEIPIPTNPQGLGAKFSEAILAIQHGETASPWAIDLDQYVQQIRK